MGNGRKEDLDEAVQRQRDFVSSSQTERDENDTYGSLARHLNHIGDLLILRYQKFLLIVDLEQATESYETALALLPDNDERRPYYLMDLSESLQETFQAKGQIKDLDGAINRVREVIAWLSGGNLPLDEGETCQRLAQTLNHLGDLLKLRYQKSDLIVDIEQATESYEKALALLPDKDEMRPQYLMDLSESIQQTFKAKGQIEDLDGTIDRVREAVACLSGGNAPLDEGDTYASLAQTLNHLGDLLKLRYQKSGLIVDLEQATKSYDKALSLLPDNDEGRPGYLRDLAGSLYLTFEAKGQIEDLSGAIDRLREALARLPSGNVPLEGEILGSLAQDLRHLGALHMLRYTNSGLIVDLEQANESYDKALALLPDNDERRLNYLMQLSECLQETFKAKGQIEDLDRAICRVREAIACLSAQDLNLLGDLLKLRYRKFGLIVDLEQGNESYGKALVALPDKDERRPRYLIDLSESLHLTFQAKDQTDDLTGAIDRLREALACLSNGNGPPDEHETCIHLCNLGGLLSTRFRCTGEMADLDEAIQCQYQAMELDPTKRHSALDELSAHLYDLYLVTRDLSDLERALGFSREALECCPVDDSSSRLQIKRHMAVYLDGRLERSDRAADLKETLEIRREMVNLTEGKDGHHKDVRYLVHSLRSQWVRNPEQLSAFDEGIQQLRDVLQTGIHGPDRMDLLDDLATFLDGRYQRSRAPEDLEEAIRYLRELTALIPLGHIRRARLLSSLADVLLCRFDLFGRIDDIDDALDSARESVKIVRSSHVRDDLVQCLTTLATCLDSRYHSTGRLDDIEEAIAVGREVVSLSPDSSTALRNLAASILSRQELLRQAEGIEEVIILLRKSLTIIPAEHPDKLKSLGYLATAALVRCKLGRIEYQEEALELCRESVAAHGQFDPDDSYCFAVGQLANACWIKGDYEEAFTRYEQAANMRCATPHSRFTVTTWWASMAVQTTSGHSSSLRAHTKALELLDQCLTSTPTIDLQHQFLTNNPDFASNAAACAIEKEEPETAIEALEHGRALLWSRIRGYRHSIDKLQESNPGLAEEFKKVCQQLEHLTVSSRPELLGMTPIPISTAPYASHGLHFDAKMTKNRQLSGDYERVISEIRQLDGFSSFLQAIPFSTLQKSASEGPVILVNVNEHRSDAIILRATDTPLLVPLPETLFAMVDTLSARLVVVDLINRDEDRKGVAHQAKKVDMGNILQLLWKSVCQPIALALQEMGHPTGSRVWWCPVGRLSALPLHAAGIYNNKGVLIEGFPDLYVSSYTPTLSSLNASRETAVKGGSEPRLLAVGQSNALPKVGEEFSKLKRLFPRDVLTIQDGEAAETDTVLSHLRDHSWVHFACHGSLDESSPFKSGFVLYDKKLSLRDIMQAKLPNAELAFLAACHSAASESTSKTPDEVLTLAAAMQFCGFRSIVGTLWTMSDSDGPVLAEKFYKHMLRHGLDKLDVRDSAEAVHLATKSMREAGVPLHRWTTFVHLGI
ncbi:hypothetical protein EW026_g7612 [Hermanssonia centrifuga]|uniref:CHAT domain-containing protein n=1 Tax=Hermanssonia centrifuga TaxID=98765 RepID=A0A4S4K7B1_9APHY|nr:hypothetical protein EW026_g7612 [Hermanssonia centrifuga]